METDNNDFARVKIILTDEELQFPAIDELIAKFKEWLILSKENEGGRKTRAANRRADALYDEIMSYKIPPIKVDHQEPVKICHLDSSIDSDGDSASSRPVTRSLRSRSRTPVQAKNPSKRQLATPSTPRNQRIRTHLMKQPPSGTSSVSSGSSSVLNAALNQQHPSVSVNKIRQLLRADSAQKKRNEEKERQERLMLDRKAKEERAEAQKKQLLEERAVTAKLKREQRLLHAAEVRKAREEARKQLKLRDQESKKCLAATQNGNHVDVTQNNHVKEIAIKETEEKLSKQQDKQNNTVKEDPTPKFKNPDLNVTFKKPAEDLNNIDISVHDETTEDNPDKAPITAAWARAPYIRDALVKQFSKPDAERMIEVLKIFPGVKLPIDLAEIFGSNKAVHSRYLCRTSSAVWTPPHRSMKRSSSFVLTPNSNAKRQT